MHPDLSAQTRRGPLPENGILVHLGPHKTGTTAIQSTLADLREELAGHGVLYPGRKIAHHAEAKSLLQYQQGWTRDAEPPPPLKVWTRFAARAAEAEQRVVISSEFFAEANSETRRDLVRDLGDERVHLIIAARNPAGIALSSWQQVVRTYGRSVNLKHWLERSFRRDGDPADPANRFWRRADSAALVSRWLEVVPAERITVVVLDERDRRLLPATFEQLLGLPDGLLADHQPPKTNRGLTALELALVRQINQQLDRRISWADYTRTMRAGVIQRLLEVRQPGPDEARNLLPAWAVDQALAEAERTIAGLQRSGVRIVGDLASLRTVPARTGQTRRIKQVPIELAAEAVVGAIAVATRDSWSLDAPLKPQPEPQSAPVEENLSPRVDSLTAKQLGRVLAQRVRAGARRRVKRLVRR